MGAYPMAPKDQDTDPSTPGAMRADPRAALAGADTEPTPPKLHGTDPGLGPGATPPPPWATGAVAAGGATAGPSGKNDSVDILLDGISGAQPERTKTTPQTDGDASASYHAAHVVRPARTSPDDMPKVVVDRPAAPPTLRIDRAVIQRAVAMASAAAGDEQTVIRPPALIPRVIVAIVAGLIVVMALFVILKLTARKTPANDAAGGVEPSAPVVITAAPATPPATTPPEATASEPPPPLPTTLPTIAVTALPTAPAAGTARPPSSARPRSKSAPSGTSDLGEFKTTFH